MMQKPVLVMCVLGALLAASAAQAQSLDPTTIPKYVTPLFVPPPMPIDAVIPDPGGDIDSYEIAARPFEQQVLPPGFPMTPVFAFGSPNHPGSFHYPAATIEARTDRAVRVKWLNQLVDQDGFFVPHLLDVVQHIHWANPPMDCKDGPPRTDCAGNSAEAYQGPVPLVVHLHGAHAEEESDGYPEAWYLPAAVDIPAGYAVQGSLFDQIAGAAHEPGAAVYEYANDQRATALWYHPHSLGITRLNTYAGLAGFYILRGGPSDLTGGELPAGDYEIPLAIQDRSFNDDGTLWYRDVTASVKEPFHGNTMVVNGNTWPYLVVEPRRYRFRVLNGSNSRMLELRMVTGSPDGPSFGPFWQIGSDGGFLPAPVSLQELDLGAAERADVIVDFTGLATGSEIYLINKKGPGTPDTTGQVMKLIVGTLNGVDTSLPADQLQLPGREPVGPADVVRQVSVNPDARLGTVDLSTGLPIELGFADAVTENALDGATETWEIYNFSDDPHPIHLHVVQFEVVEREDMLTGITRGPEPWETGTKDTVMAHEGEITRVKATFDIPGLFVWHCHMLEHEDDEMMRPFTIEDNLFFDTFERGDLSRWSAVGP
ncbi:MAG TPA: multicopper oxidase domain-containing protein [Methylomirabilota bacterium]|nr:multicopper oxidase domain-containing protein [Methylomirabilota bacterium]